MADSSSVQEFVSSAAIDNKADFTSLMDSVVAALAPQTLSRAFVEAAFLSSACEPILSWREHRTACESTHTLQQAFLENLLPITHLQPLILAATIADLERYRNRARALTIAIADRIGRSLRPERVREFTRETLASIQALALQEGKFERERSQGEHADALEHTIYRAFDDLDRAFAIDYSRDHGMPTNGLNTERLYEGAGLGVQTSYMTLVVALASLSLKPGARLIDLGSGYGRMGLVAGALRPDVDFIGYEYVPHRVEVANQASHHLGSEASVKFATQDLSDLKFQIPVADVYYMYDPFTEQTYQTVFEQLIEIGRKHVIAIVSKGGAGPRIAHALEQAGAFADGGASASWTADRSLDLGTLCIFRSRP